MKFVLGQSDFNTESIIFGKFLDVSDPFLYISLHIYKEGP